MHLYRLLSEIIDYYGYRGLTWPADADEALDWALTELAEAKELLLARRRDWVRNHPEDEESFSQGRLEEELGDILMMVLVAGLVEDVHPVRALREKMARKMNQ